MFKRNMFYTTAGRDGRKKISTLGRGVKGVLNNDKKLNNCKEGHSLLTKSQNFVICILKGSRKHDYIDNIEEDVYLHSFARPDM